MQNVDKEPVSAATSPSTTVVSRAKILLSLLTINPFGKITTNDLNKEKLPSFSVFCRRSELYSFPESPSEAEERVQENVRQFTGNYIAVFIFFFIISLYKKPIPFLTLLVCFPVTDYVHDLVVRKGLDLSYPFIRHLLFFIPKLGLATLLMRTEAVIAFSLSLGAAYLAMLLHGALRKLRSD